MYFIIINFINGKELTAKCLKRMDLVLCHGIVVNSPETGVSEHHGIKSAVTQNSEVTQNYGKLLI